MVAQVMQVDKKNYSYLRRISESCAKKDQFIGDNDSSSGSASSKQGPLNPKDGKSRSHAMVRRLREKLFLVGVDKRVSPGRRFYLATEEIRERRVNSSTGSSLSSSSSGSSQTVKDSVATWKQIVQNRKLCTEEKGLQIWLFRENSRSADGGYRIKDRRGYRHRLRTEQDHSADDVYVSPLSRFRKIARLVQLALIFYSGEGRTRGRNKDEDEEVHQSFFDKSDKMTFLPAFDPSFFKAQRIKEIVVGADIKEILGKRPVDRSEEEIQQVLFALRTYETFAEYPLNMQERMCRKAHYLRFGANRIILRQGDRAEWFYYVLSGTTAVSILEENKLTGSVNLRNVGYLTRGTAFGELALLHGSRRTATVSCKDTVELIAVDKADFVEMNQLDSEEEKDHIRYCRTLKILEDWPVNMLNDSTGVCNFAFFKKGTVMAKSNHDTPFIYIVKSGHVRVLTKVSKIRQKCPQGYFIRSRTASSRTTVSKDSRSTSSNCSNGYNRNHRMYSRSTNSVPTHGSSRYLRGNLVPLISRLSVGDGRYEEVPIQPTFLQVCILGQGDSFGLSTLVYQDEICCGIVSLGAECIEISKEFFVKHASENYLRKLKASIRPFPSEDKLQEDIQHQKLWSNYKRSVVAQVLDPSSI